MVKNYLKKCLVSLFVSSFLFASCVDQGYDLSKDIDLAIHIGGDGLALPVGSTDSIKLSKIIKVDESDVLHLNAGGEYSLSKKDTVDPAVKVTVNSADPIVMDQITLPTVLLYKYDASLLRTGTRSIDLDVNTSGTFKLRLHGIPDDVHTIKNIDVSTPVKSTIKFTLTGVKSNADVRFNNLKLKFPDFIVSDQLNANHELIINDNITSGLTKTIYINRFDFSYMEGGALKVNQNLDLSENVTLSGGITASSLDASVVTGDINLGTFIQINPATISAVEGQIEPSINVNIKPISLDIPDFLEDDAVTMDVENPMINLNVNNHTDFPIIIDGMLKGIRNGKEISHVAIQGTSANPIKIDANGRTFICLSKTGKGGSDKSKNYQIANLNDLITTIPDQIQFTMNAHADQSSTHKVLLGKTYNVEIGYNVEVPFRFGSGLAIVYNDTIDDINKSIKDLDVKKVTINTTIENNIPLNLQLQVTPVGIDKKPITGISVEVKGENGNTSGIIQSCDKDGKTQESPITIELTEATSGAIKDLDGLLLKITAKSTETVNGMPLKDTQYIRLKNIKAKASGGMNVDLNDK